MKRITLTYLLLLKNYKRFKFVELILLLLVLSSFVKKENSSNNNINYSPPITVPCNTDAPIAISSSSFTDLTVTENTNGLCLLGCGISNLNNLTDTNLSNYTTISTLLGLGVTHTITVTDNTTDEFFEGGSYAGFLIENGSVAQIDLLGAITIRTYLNGVPQETNSGASLVTLGSSLLNNDQFYVGFYTTLDYDSIEVSIASLAGIASSTNIYYPVTNSFCVGPNLEPNTPTLINKPDFPARVVDEHTGMGGVLNVGSVTNTNAAVDSNSNSYTSIDFTLGVIATGSMSIKDELTNYPAQTYVGFDIENASVLNLELLDGITITTYLDGVQQEVKTGSSELLSVDSGLLFTGTERSQVGFVTSLPFDEAQLSIQQTLTLDLGSTRVYGLILEAFSEGNLNCDTATLLNNPSQPVIINNTNTGVNGVACVACEVDNATNVISESESDFAMINVTAGVASTASISVENVLSNFPSGSAAGFVIRDTNDLLQLDLLNSLTITTYLDGSVQETQSGNNLLALEALGLINITPSTTNGFYLVGFSTSLEYDEIQLTVSSLAATINSIEVYGSYVDNSIKILGNTTKETSIGASDGSISLSVSGGTPPYTYLWSPGDQTSSSISGLTQGSYNVTVTDASGCQSTAEYIIYTDGVQYPVPCNTENPVAVTNDNFTDLTVDENTSGLCVVGCGISDASNIIDTDPSNFASVSTLIGLGVTHTLTVTDNTASEFIESGGYAGFLIENISILQADLLNAITITTYLDGVQQETNTSTSLLALDSPILGQDQFYVGFYTSMNYDAVEISISSLAGVASTTNVYAAVTNRFCEGPELACNTATQLTKPNFPVRAVEEHTGTGGLLTLGSVNNTNNAIDSDTSNYASIDLLAGVAGTATIAYKNEITDYTANTFAGFDIENTTLLNTQLFDAITISTYLDGTLVESKTGTTELLPIYSGLLLTGSESVRLGFITTAPFDEVQLSMTQTLSLNLGSTRVYGMVLQSFCPGTINCDEPYVISNPSSSVIINNENTGTDGVACIACEVDNAVNIISEDNSDYALINIMAGVAGSASISVQDVLVDYPAGTQAGFIIRDTNDLLQADLLNTLTITTYLDGVQQEQQTANNLLALEALGLVNITPTSTDSFYVVAFDTSTGFDEIQLTVNSLVAAVNSIEVYGGYIDATNSTFCQQAGIALLKEGVFNDTDSDGCSNPGETITYTYTVTNTGNVSITNVELTDPISPSPLTLNSGDTDGDNELDVDETWVYSLDYIITQDDIDNGSVTGQATVTGVSTGGTNVSDLSDDDSTLEDDPTVTNLCQNEGIALIKQGTINDENGDGCSDNGETITFTLSVINTGNTTLNSIVVTDPLLTVSYSSGDTDSDNELDVDEIWIYTGSYIVTPLDITNTFVQNQATVQASTLSGGTVSDQSDDNSILEDDITTIDLCQAPDIAIVKTATFNDENSDGCSNVGETITYTMTVTNQGNTGLINVTVNDPLLGGPVTLNSGDLNTNNTLDVGEIWIYTADYAITQTNIDNGSITNQATASGESSQAVVVTDLSDNDSVLEDDPTQTTMCQSDSIALIKTATFNDENTDGCSDIGETITYSFTLTNTGNTTITNVVLTDPMLGGTITLASGDTDSDNQLDINETWSYSANYTITQANIDNGSVTNQATVTGTSISGNNVSDLSDNDSILEDGQTQTTLCQSDGIALIKTATFNDENTDGCSDVGETITYSFTLTNTGNTTITNVVLTDSMLGGTIILASGDTDNDNELDINESWSYTANYTITQANIDNGSVTNQATVTGTSISGNNVSDLSDDNSTLEDDQTQTNLCQSDGIALIKTATFNDEDNDGCSDVGETITYNFALTNTGNTTITNMILTDPMLGGTITLASGDINSNNQLDINETWSYSASYTITQSDIDNGSVSNQATVTGTSISGNNVSDLSDDNSILEDDQTQTTLCQPNNSISLEKVSTFNDANGNGYANVGETITYSFIIYNTGDSVLYNITLQDNLPGITINGSTIPQLLPGEVDSTTFTAIYVITEQDLTNESVTNQALVTAEDSSGGSVTDTSDDPNNLDDIDIDNDGDPDDPTITDLPVEEIPFEIFNAVSPDEDGANDFFRINGIENYPNNNLKVFNRWGVLVYQTDAYGINGNLFRGISEGRTTVSKDQKLPTGTYFYILTRWNSDQEAMTDKGYLYLKRN
ncbi:conserved repeat domain-containing protein/gliding motility-associated C-terminal domain-containing protein [Tenacibaculum mesophilum]|uniref:Cadherin domain-containing protein n=1 Tax=Tenacibaculum mesophilum TaxID=104268 RepID=A0ABM7CFT5_9FLAO|nr:hypothetical protein D6200_08855 [Tenacibaculum mesophilum]QFS27908.1 hypothetical protein F9Y86_05695 [Tenacibaculum mesophilum]SHG06258.1 conserved repeat domain-containing protein/gliding motility-associated C-terminal domain-containing protein [Tenacibaculum mesophilum]